MATNSRASRQRSTLTPSCHISIVMRMGKENSSAPAKARRLPTARRSDDQPCLRHRPGPGRIQQFVHDYPYVHLSAAILGKSVFVAGSVLFLVGMRTPGTWAFLVGSSAMLLGSIGQRLRWVGQRELKS